MLKDLITEENTMNNRIKELVLQANIYVSETAQRRSSNCQSDDMKYSKLAELIVKECDNYVAKNFDELEPGDLLKHFGVK